MNSIIRVSCAVNRVSAGNPQACCAAVLKSIQDLGEKTPDIIVFPASSLCPPSTGSLLQNTFVLDSCRAALDRIAVETKNLDAYLLIGMPIVAGMQQIEVTAVLYRGKILGMVPSADASCLLKEFDYSNLLLPLDTVFACGNLRFSILGCPPEQLSLQAATLQNANCDLIICPSYLPAHAGSANRAMDAARLLSQSLGCAVAICNGGVGDTTSPNVYAGFAAIYESGEEMQSHKSAWQEFTITADLDCDVIRAAKRRCGYRFGYRPAVFSIVPVASKKGLLRKISQNPFLPQNGRKAAEYIGQLFELQAQSLAGRMSNIGSKRMVIGVSGGLDSTLALLVCAKAADLIGLGRENILAVTMPGFGTSDRTYTNALTLIEKLGATLQEIPIRASVLQHFADIGHDPQQKDVTYENAQARERTQILFDLANSWRGIVVGTGDLSEIALGWCTFGGDHLSGFSVNSCLTKTMVQVAVDVISRYPEFETVGEILQDILETPISPELLPPDESGSIQQKTEEILGPYVMHEFFLYYFVFCGFRPSKVYHYACAAFAGELEPEFLAEKLKLFLKRFLGSQFKRSCASDAAAITPFVLSPDRFMIPSDLSAQDYLQELEASLNSGE